jgi:hypothetical protein
MAKAKTGRTAAKKSVGAKARGGKKPVDMEQVREKILGAIGNAAPEMAETMIEEVTTRANMTALKYLFEMAGLHPRTEAPVPDKEETMTDLLIRKLEMGLVDDESAEEDSAPEGAALDTVE